MKKTLALLILIYAPQIFGQNYHVSFTGSGESTTVAAGKLKETVLVNWTSPNTGAINESGFTALPNGNRGPAGTCSGYKNFSYLWSSTERDGTYAWYCSMMYNFTIADSGINTAKSVGLGVRCIKNL